MLAAIRSAAVFGVDAYDVTVEVDATKGLPQWTMVGLAAGAVKEAKERVAAALVNAGFVVPPRRYTVNLAPADQRKDGTAFDLPIALGVLVATGQLEPELLHGIVALGELGLDGTIRPVRGVLPVAMHLMQSPRPPASALTLVVPPGNAREAVLVAGVCSIAPFSLEELVTALRARLAGVPFQPLPRAGEATSSASPGHAEQASDATSEQVDLSDVAGQETAKRAMEIAAAGGHAVLMIGPPGGGKTMLARRLPTILPPLTDEETLEVLAVHSVAGLITHGDLAIVQRPFRAPHHTLSIAALIGGGSSPRPGEVSLAHHGVLFLDELQEMPRSVLDALRQPMEDGRVHIARAQLTVVYPARFALVGAMNPCPCGYAGQAHRVCRCASNDVARHRARVSGPLLDRIDMTIHVPAVPLDVLHRAVPSESSLIVRARVVAARLRQRVRYQRLRRVTCNAHVQGRWLDAHTPITADARALLASSASRLGFSARGYHRVFKVARTIADLDAADVIASAHIGEAIFFRAPENLPAPDPVT